MGANPDQCRLISIAFFSHQNLCDIFSESLLCLKYLPICIVYFSTQRNTLFYLTRLATNYFLFVVKIFTCALCCAILLCGISFSSNLSLIVVCSVVAMTRTSAAGHPSASSRLCSSPLVYLLFFFLSISLFVSLLR